MIGFDFVSINRLIVGLLFFFYLPGAIIVYAYFDREKKITKALLTVAFSIMIGLIVGIFFGYNRTQARIFGGFTTTNIYLGEVIVILALTIIALIRRYKKHIGKRHTPRTASSKKDRSER